MLNTFQKLNSKISTKTKNTLWKFFFYIYKKKYHWETIDYKNRQVQKAKSQARVASFLAKGTHLMSEHHYIKDISCQAFYINCLTINMQKNEHGDNFEIENN